MLPLRYNSEAHVGISGYFRVPIVFMANTIVPSVNGDLFTVSNVQLRFYPTM